MNIFAATYGPPQGEEFEVRRRMSFDSWEIFLTTSTGIRSLGYV
jgi:hypothetical protein